MRFVITVLVIDIQVVKLVVDDDKDRGRNFETTNGVTQSSTSVSMMTSASSSTSSSASLSPSTSIESTSPLPSDAPSPFERAKASDANCDGSKFAVIVGTSEISVNSDASPSDSEDGGDKAGTGEGGNVALLISFIFRFSAFCLTLFYMLIGVYTFRTKSKKTRPYTRHKMRSRSYCQ